VSESRYLLSFTALLAGALVVCAPMVLFRTAAEHDTSWLDAEPQIAPYAVAGKGWEATVTTEPDLRAAIAQLPAVSLAQVDTDVADLPEARPVLAVLSAEDTTNADEPSPEPLKVAQIEEVIIDESSGASVTYSAEPAPRSIAQAPSSEPVAGEAQVAELDETHATSNTQPEAQEQMPEPVRVAELDETQQAPEPVPDDINVSEEPSGVDGSTSSVTLAPETTPDIAPPLPSRRPASPIKTAEIVVAQEGQETSARMPAQRTEGRNDEVPPHRWRPMALAPADADTPAPPKLSAPAPKSAQPSMSASAHRSKVWSALARAKPRTGERGSATVTFNIGANGALRGARIARSSGNAKIDQAALATVRKAGPFPAPPGLKSGAASYSIRMDFR
jgi:protein TonB